jgi:hypothetical protein
MAASGRTPHSEARPGRSGIGATPPPDRPLGKDGCPCFADLHHHNLRAGEPPEGSWMEARVTKVTRVSARFSKSLASRRFRPNQEKVRSTTQRRGRDDEALRRCA